MAINRFQNPDILVTSKVPVENVKTFSLADASNLRSLNHQIEINELSYGGCVLESHIYSADLLISSQQQSTLEYQINDTDPDTKLDLLLTPERDVRLGVQDAGYYSIVYNFVQPLTQHLRISNISADRTEVELEYDSTQTNIGLSQLFNKIQNPSDSNQLNLGLNFENNNICTITDVSFYNNERVGEMVKIMPPPMITSTSISPLPATWNGTAERTFFAPSEEGKDGNYWVEFFYSKKPNAYGNQVYQNTGRVAKWNPILNTSGSLVWQQEVDSSGDAIFYKKNASTDDREYEIRAGEYYNKPPRSSYTRRLSSIYKYSKIRYYDPAYDSSKLKTVCIKLYNPLPDGLQAGRCTIDEIKRDSYIERVLVYDLDKTIEQDQFSPPNFKIDMGNYGKSQGTDLKSWNDLLDTNLSTSQQIIDKYISGSFGGTPLNLDYTHFKSFVKYSSAVERVNNFQYKLTLIESFNKRVTTLESVSGSEAMTNISQSIVRKDNVVSGMDGWERWMYQEKTGSLYTHYSSSAYPLEPWPKDNSSVNYSVTSSQGLSAYNGLIDSASIHDSLNDARLTKVVPSAIVEDPLNKEYVLFVDMIGHHFDITWSYINALTSINEREEHPYDGMPNELLYDVAKSMGWKLTHGKDTSELWEFGLGTDKYGNVPNSGSLPSKSHEQINSEVWRRIVNNIPYLLKTKGSARAVKALIATYGIPQTFLSIREYGGPVIETKVRPMWEHDRFVYHLRMDNDNYITVPWDKITDINSNTYELGQSNPIDVIELQVQQNMNRDTAVIRKGSDFAVLYESTGSATTLTKGNIHFYLSGSSGYKSASIMDVPLFDKNMSTLLIERENSVDDITKDNLYKLQYRRNRKDRISVSKSASISIDGSTESSYNAAWTGSGVVEFGKAFGTVSGAPSLWADTNTMSGSIQEIRYWAEQLKDIVIDEHTLSRESYHGNSPTSSYFDLKFRFLPDSNLKTIANPDSHPSQHPNQKVTGSLNGSHLTASLFNFENDDLIGVTEEYYTKVPSAGANNILNNKVRVEENTLRGILDSDEKKEESQYDSAPVDSNVVGVYLSATKMYNDDIINHTGYFEIDDYIGNPDRRSGMTEQNEELDYVRRQVFKKYASKNLINTTIDILAKYDMSVFEQIRQTMPARVDYNSGILIEPHILERPKVKSLANIGYTQPQYDVTIASMDRPLESSYHLFETEISNSYSLSAENHLYEAAITESIVTLTANTPYYSASIDIPKLLVITSQKDDVEDLGNPKLGDMYLPSQYRYKILNYKAGADVGHGINWNTGSNGYWNYDVVQKNISEHRPAQYAQFTKFFYSSEASASMNLFSSSSLHPSQTTTDELPLAVENLRYLGCKMKSDSLTTNSPDTPDGKPVIEIFTADPNVLIKTSQTGDEGNLDVDAGTGIATLEIGDLIVDDELYWKRLEEYRRELREFKRKLEHMIRIEKARNIKADIRMKDENKRRNIEMKRRSEFNIKNEFNG